MRRIGDSLRCEGWLARSHPRTAGWTTRQPGTIRSRDSTANRSTFSFSAADSPPGLPVPPCFGSTIHPAALSRARAATWSSTIRVQQELACGGTFTLEVTSTIDPVFNPTRTETKFCVLTRTTDPQAHLVGDRELSRFGLPALGPVLLHSARHFLTRRRRHFVGALASLGHRLLYSSAPRRG